MKEQIISVTEAARGFSDLINRVSYRGESATLVKNGRAVARIVPVDPPPVTGAELAKKWKSWKHLSQKEADAFARDIEEGRRSLKPLHSPWDK